MCAKANYKISIFYSQSLSIHNYVLNAWVTQTLVYRLIDQHSKAAQNVSKTTTSKANASPSLTGSETDASTSTENLSMEERYYIKHNARQEPQGQEKQEVQNLRSFF